MSKRRLLDRLALAHSRRNRMRWRYPSFRPTAGERLAYKLSKRHDTAERRQKRGQRIWTGEPPYCTNKLGFSRMRYVDLWGPQLIRGYANWPRRKVDFRRSRLDDDCPF